MSIKLVRFTSALVLIGLLLFALGLYVPAMELQLKQWERQLGGDHRLHLIAGSLIPLTVLFLLKAYRWPLRWQCYGWLLFVVAFGIDEYMQRFSELRSSNLPDFLYSAAGWAIGIIVYAVLVFLRYLKKR